MPPVSSKYNKIYSYQRTKYNFTIILQTQSVIQILSVRSCTYHISSKLVFGSKKSVLRKWENPPVGCQSKAKLPDISETDTVSTVSISTESCDISDNLENNGNFASTPVIKKPVSAIEIQTSPWLLPDLLKDTMKIGLYEPPNNQELELHTKLTKCVLEFSKDKETLVCKNKKGQVSLSMLRMV